jgi:hypothetical protein
VHWWSSACGSLQQLVCYGDRGSDHVQGLCCVCYSLVELLGLLLHASCICWRRLPQQLQVTQQHVQRVRVLQLCAVRLRSNLYRLRLLLLRLRQLLLLWRLCLLLLLLCLLLLHLLLLLLLVRLLLLRLLLLQLLSSHPRVALLVLWREVAGCGSRQYGAGCCSRRCCSSSPCPTTG